MVERGRMLASGRDADIYELGAGRVLRRARNGRSTADEARTMAYARDRGYPVPEVFDVSDDGVDLVMARIDGPTMVDAAAARPWRIRRYGRMLAELHQVLHEIAAPAWVPAAGVGEGDRLLHLDLHPLNVLVSAEGPVVIDWTNAASGDPAVDVAFTWALVASGEVPARGLQAPIVRFGRAQLLGAFLAPFAGDHLTETLAEVVERKATDPNMSPAEVARMREVARAAAQRRS